MTQFAARAAVPAVSGATRSSTPASSMAVISTVSGPPVGKAARSRRRLRAQARRRRHSSIVSQPPDGRRAVAQEKTPCKLRAHSARSDGA